MSRTHDLSKYHKRSEPCEVHKVSELFKSRDLSETFRYFQLSESFTSHELTLTNGLAANYARPNGLWYQTSLMQSLSEYHELSESSQSHELTLADSILPISGLAANCWRFNGLWYPYNSGLARACSTRMISRWVWRVFVWVHNLLCVCFWHILVVLTRM